MFMTDIPLFYDTVIVYQIIVPLTQLDVYGKKLNTNKTCDCDVEVRFYSFLASRLGLRLMLQSL